MFPSVGGTDLDSVTETKQSSICFIELFFTMVNDFRVQHVSSHPNPLYLKSLENHSARWQNQLLFKHKNVCFNFSTVVFIQ